MNRYSVEDQMERFGLSREDAEEKVRKIKEKLIHKWNIYSIEDQMKKYNLTKQEAIDKINSIKNVNVFSIEWQMKRFKLTKEEAINKIEKIKNNIKKKQSELSEFDFKSMVPSKKEHWIKKGYSENDAKVMASNNIANSTYHCMKFVKDKNENPQKYIGMYDTSLEYYLKRGYSNDDSKEMLKNRQSTFTLEKCISKYGQNEGYKIWKERQVKWYNKTKDKLSKGDYLKYESIIKEVGGDSEKADIIFQERVSHIKKSKFGKASDRSMKIFRQLIQICDKFNLKYYCGDQYNQEYYLFDKESKNIYFYDFVIPKLQTIIEFNGKLWHATNLYSINELGVDILYTIERDKMKKELAEKNGFDIFYLHEEDGFEFNLIKSINILNDKIYFYQL